VVTNDFFVSCLRQFLITEIQSLEEFIRQASEMRRDVYQEAMLPNQVWWCTPESPAARVDTGDLKFKASPGKGSETCSKTKVKGWVCGSSGRALAQPAPGSWFNLQSQETKIKVKE
jgi:hypothetical protein